jgi:hypothetical protein
VVPVFVAGSWRSLLGHSAFGWQQFNGNSIAGPQGKHVTDGAFTGGLNGIEWQGPLVSTASFAQVGNAGGSTLYVEQGSSKFGQGNTLFLLYDYWASNANGFMPGSSFFDVFFEVPPDGHDYLVRINGPGNFLAFEKTLGLASPLTNDGSFDITSSVWTPLSQADLDLAKFQASIGFGSSPGHEQNHLIAEFQLSVDDGQGSGVYSPDPAFWSASVGAKNGQGDPPISSEIFQLNPDGSTSLLGAIGSGGIPAKQQRDIATPEPASVVAAIFGIGALIAVRRSRKS